MVLLGMIAARGVSESAEQAPTFATPQAAMQLLTTFPSHLSALHFHLGIAGQLR